MKISLNSSAPHVYPAVEWQPANANENALLLYKSGALEVGIRRWQPGNHPFTCEFDTLCYFQRGRGLFRRDTGESIDVVPGTAVHFKEGWRGAFECLEPVDAS